MAIYADSYSSTAKWLHWIMAAMWIPSWIIGFIAVHWRDELNGDHQLTFLHKALGSVIVFLTVIRVAWRFLHQAPPLPGTITPTMQRLAHIGHALLYGVALLVLPLSGWYWSSVADKPIMLLGWVQLPPLVAPNQSLYAIAKWLHTLSAWVCGVLVAGHVLVALKHHWLDRDHILRRMLPQPSRRD